MSPISNLRLLEYILNTFRNQNVSKHNTELKILTRHLNEAVWPSSWTTLGCLFGWHTTGDSMSWYWRFSVRFSPINNTVKKDMRRRWTTAAHLTARIHNTTNVVVVLYCENEIVFCLGANVHYYKYSFEMLCTECIARLINAITQYKNKEGSAEKSLQLLTRYIDWKLIKMCILSFLLETLLCFNLI